MKKLLLSSVALLGASALAGQASAAENLQLNLSGFYVGSMAYVDQDSAGSGTRDYSFGSDSEIHFTGSMTLDNGLQVGFHAEGKLEEDSASADGDFIEEKFIFFEGAFGRVEFGDQDGVGDQMAVYAPTLFRGTTVNDNELDVTGLNTINTVNTIFNGGDDFATKIIYMTPRIGGFQGGISFTPELSQGGSNFDPRTETVRDEVLELGVTYFNTLENDVSLGASFTYLTADDGGTAVDIESWALGANVGFGGFTVGGSYKENEDVVGPGTDYEAWDIGGTYEAGPWGFMLSYAEDETSGIATVETSAVQGGVDYMLGAGVSIGGGLQYIEKDTGVPATEDEATVLFLETMVSF